MVKKNSLDPEGGLLGALAAQPARRPRTLARRVTAFGVAGAIALPALGLTAAPAMAADELEDSSSSSARDADVTAVVGEAVTITIPTPEGPLAGLEVTKGQLADAAVNADGTLTYTSLSAGADSLNYTGTTSTGNVQTGTIRVTVTEPAKDEAVEPAAPENTASEGAASEGAASEGAVPENTTPEASSSPSSDSAPAAPAPKPSAESGPAPTTSAPKPSSESDVARVVASSAADDQAAVVSGSSLLVDALANDTSVKTATLRVVDSSGVDASVEDGKIRVAASARFSGDAYVVYGVEGDDGTQLTGVVSVRVSALGVDDTTSVVGVPLGETAPTITAFVLSNDLGSLAAYGPGLQQISIDTTGTTGTVTSPGFGPTPDSPDVVGPKGEPLYTPAPGFVGTDTFAYSAKTSDGQVVSAKVTVTVYAPTSVSPDFATVAAGGSTVIDVLANDTTVNTASLAVSRASSDGTATVANGRITFTPTAGFSGLTSFEYSVDGTDGTFRTSRVDVTVNPTAIDDNAAAGTYAGNVTTNDLGASGARVVLVNATRFGSLDVTEDGQYSYTPTVGFTGTDSFTYRLVKMAADGTTLTSGTATVTLRTSAAVDDAVTLSAGAAQALVQVTGNDVAVDPSSVRVVSEPSHSRVIGVNADGTVRLELENDYSGVDAFTYRVDGIDGRTLEATVRLDVTPVAIDDTAAPGVVSGRVTNNDLGTNQARAILRSQASNGVVTLRENGAWTYVRNAGYTGTDSFTYNLVTNAPDGRALISGVATVSLDLPVGANDDTARVPAGSTTPIDVLANDPGVDASTLVITKAPELGTARVQGGSIVYTAPTSTSGPTSLTYEVRDSNGDTRTATLVITVTPVGVDDSFRVGVQPTPLAILANDAAARQDSFYQRVDFPQGPEHGTLNQWIPGKGEPTYTPDPGFTGIDTFTYTATDTNGNSYGATVTLDVTDTDSSASNDEAVVDSGTTTVVDVLANDEDVDPATLRVNSSSSDDVTATVVAGTLSVTASSTFSGRAYVEYSVDDDLGNVRTASLEVIVTPVAVADVVTPGNPSVDVLANDRGSLEDVTVVLDGPATGGTATLEGSVVTFTFAPGATSGTVSYHLEQAPREEQPPLDTDFPGGGGPVPDLILAAGTVEADGTLVSNSALVTFSTAPVTPPVITPPVITPPVTTAPVAVADTASTNAGDSVVVDVLANDVSANGATLSLGSADRGTLELVDGKVRYTPAAGFAGRDSFGYTVTRDGQSSSALVSVDVTPVTRDDAGLATSGQQLALDVLGNDSVGSWDLIEIVRGPANGTAGFTEEESDDNRLYYTPNAGFVGTDTVVYRVTVDGLTSESTVTFTVQPATANTPPVIAPVNNAPVVVNPVQTRPSTTTTPRSTDRATSRNTATRQRESLAYTGAETTRLLLGGGALLVLGAGLVLLGRKRFTS